MTFNFSSFPTELRLMVWEETFEPRILHVTSQLDFLSPAPFIPHALRTIPHLRPIHVRFKAREPPPIALQICRESRALALGHYTLSFHSYTHPSTLAREQEQSALYLNPELDTVHVDAGKDRVNYYNLIYDATTTQSIKALAIRARVPLTEVTDYLSTWHLFSFKRLEKLILVIETEAGGNEEQSIRERMVDKLIKSKERFRARGRGFEGKLPTVKVMNPHEFENQ